MKMKMKITLMVAVILAVIRVWMSLNIAPDAFHWAQAYKDAAHLFMGGLVVAAWRDNRPWQWSIFWGLSALEVLAAVLSRI